MTWHRQVLHVARKDLGRVRTLLVIYLLLVAGATAAASGWAPSPENLLLLAFTGGFLLLGLVLAALLVQSDPASGPDAYWVTKPLDPSAIVAAKVLVVLVVVVGPVLLGKAAALTLLDVSPGDLPALLAGSAATFAMLLLAAALIAALSKDIPAFILSMIVVAIGVVLLAGVWDLTYHMSEPNLSGGGSVADTAPVWPGWFLSAVAALLLAYQYRQRLRRSGILLSAGTAVLLVALLPRTVRPREAVEYRRNLPVIASSGRLHVTQAHFETAAREQGPTVGMLVLSLRGEWPTREHSHDLILDSLHVVLASGESRSVRTAPQRVRLHDSELPLPAGVEFSGPGRRMSLRQGLVHVAMAPEVLATVMDGVAIAVYGRMQVLEPRVIGKLPLQPGPATVVGGNRVQVCDCLPAEFGGIVTVSITSIRSRANEYRLDTARPSVFGYALVNEQAGAAVELHPDATMSFGFWPVLPGMWGLPQGETLVLSLLPRSRYAPGLSPAVVADGVLHVVDWVPVSQYHATASAPLGQRRHSR